jgi:hypothetical protein
LRGGSWAREQLFEGVCARDAAGNVSAGATVVVKAVPESTEVLRHLL